MSDLVALLRERGDPLSNRAAAEIARLSAELDALRPPPDKALTMRAAGPGDVVHVVVGATPMPPPAVNPPVVPPVAGPPGGIIPAPHADPDPSTPPPVPTPPRRPSRP